jgi:hypothetical protein
VGTGFPSDNARVLEGHGPAKTGLDRPLQPDCGPVVISLKDVTQLQQIPKNVKFNNGLSDHESALAGARRDLSPLRQA